jgi:hypothetical protein
MDVFIQTGRPISFICKTFKSIALTVPEIFTNLLAEDTCEEIIIVLRLSGESGSCKCFSYSENPYISH